MSSWSYYWWFWIKKKKKKYVSSSLLMFCIVIVISLHVSFDTINSIQQQQTTTTTSITKTKATTTSEIHVLVNTVATTSPTTTTTTTHPKPSMMTTSMYCPMMNISSSSSTTSESDTTSNTNHNDTILSLSQQQQQQQQPLFYQWNQHQQQQQQQTSETDHSIPATQFTTQIENSILPYVETNSDIIEDKCKYKFYFYVDIKYSKPTSIHCMGMKLSRIVPWWCKIFQQIFDLDGKSIPQPQQQQYSSNNNVKGTNKFTLTTRILPTNLTIAISTNDKDYDDDNMINQFSSLSLSILDNTTTTTTTTNTPDPISSTLLPKKLSCLASSSPNGIFTIPNFLEIQRMVDQTQYQPKPWNNRCPIPIWRGSAWMMKNNSKKRSKQNNNNNNKEIIDDDDDNNNAIIMPWWYSNNDDSNNNTFSKKTKTTSSNTIVMTDVLLTYVKKSTRLQAVLYSKQYPTLLDARISDPKNGFMNTQTSTKLHKLWSNNATNGLQELLPIHDIIPSEYYTNYQVSVVLCGLGASFRTSVLLSTATAVVIQDCPNSIQEWFISLMKPYVHYIPLDVSLNDIHTTMVWISKNPLEVQKIASNGYTFYNQYLSFERNYEHIYELLYRISYKKLTIEEEEEEESKQKKKSRRKMKEEEKRDQQQQERAEHYNFS